MKKLIPIAVLTVAVFTLFYFWEKNEVPSVLEKDQAALYPEPTEIFDSAADKMKEEAESQARRDAWFERMHAAPDDMDWRAIEARTRYERHQKRALLKQGGAVYRGEEILANGNLTGEWKERGSKNQAGRVVATDYDPETDEIWLISDGGSLFKGPRDGSNWQVINDDLRFNDAFLKAIPHNGGRRWIAFIEDVPHYSDDDGITWTPSFGIFYTNSSGSFHMPVILDDADATMYVLQKDESSSDIRLFRSTDHGEIWVLVQTLPFSSFRRVRMISPHNSDLLYILRRDNSGLLSLYQVNGSQLDLVSTTNIDLGNQRVNFTATVFAGDTIMYTHDEDMIIHKSTDAGLTWEAKGPIPTVPWSVGLFVTKTDPDILYTGDIECYTSTDGGNEWIKLADWWQYYNNVQYRIHADMMYFNEFKTSAGDRFLLISNDGGLSVNNDDYYNLSTGYENIGLEDLNVSQYYDVRSDFDPSHYFIYAGSQDQGFQRAFTNFSNEGILDFEQTISGDYGHISFSQNGERMWAVYPGGLIHYYNDPEYGGIAAQYFLESTNETSAWIPPMMDAPNLNENHVFLAGGDATGGNGAHIIQLEKATDLFNADSIAATNLPYDFWGNDGNLLTALAASKIDFNRWYVATSEGAFYTSNDYGQSWTKSNEIVPEGQYLYGQAILPSRVDLETVYLGGSGYNNPAVLKSTDGGITFSPMSEGLPATLVYDLATNEDESLIFAGTEAGPYVYVTAEEKWYDMSGTYAPAQNYWSVEYLDEDQIVRFGTYGRGIWDFQIKNEVSVFNVAKAKFEVKAFPNPSTGIINLEWNDAESATVNAQLFDLTGKLVFERIFDNNAATNSEVIDLSHLSQGNYFLKFETDSKMGTQKINILK
ncbi:MAG: T9SS type A sorting domain-containing protein [Bacteroidota bacterium]